MKRSVGTISTTMPAVRGTLASLCFIGYYISASAIYVFKGNPYGKGQLEVQQLTLTKTGQGCPVHTVAFLPTAPDDYAPVFFIGGWRGFFPAEVYTDVLTQIAAHGFVVFGADPYYPLLDDEVRGSLHNVGADINILFRQLDWLRGYMQNRTAARVAWNSTVLACHSAGCDSTLRMIQQNHTVAKASIFLEPYGTTAQKPVAVKIPVLSYGTELSEAGYPQCCRKGTDWRQFYTIFSCPRLLMEVKGFGHCDILDDAPWQACHDIKFCTTTNKTRNSAYHQFVQGAVTAFLTGTLEGYDSNLRYILNTKNIPFEMVDLQSDFMC